MSRPSLKDQRSEQILDAYLTCVARYGLDGATQERIAKEAGVKRPLLRHYLGNKEEMTAALAAHVVAEYAALTGFMQAEFGAVETAAGLVELLYRDDPTSDPRLMLAWQALIVAVADYPDMRDPLLDSLARFIDAVEATLRRVAPEARVGRIRAVTQGIVAPYVTLDSISPLKPPKNWRAEMKQSAMILAASLTQDLSPE
ncbi:TetR/AcrR family transcriptional regulator [Pseudophaeobacter sp. EL27]|uniref:TetR/AcrR family transcriptional regulator n=1 Tax=Pseudophaeobacter sp. EL27 TaxID=2107580 RepID=UPI000EFB70DF|nr:TetR/AcrR family transcriptional regulator [Pseudophaeobacter sp. EL27]